MKNKKSLLGLGLLALVLVLGVGYAVVSEVVLEFGGTATVANHALKVDIKEVTDSETTANVTHSITTEGHKAKDTFSITGLTLGEEVTMTYTVDNHETDVDALIDKATIEVSNSDFFEVTTIDTLDNTAERNGGTATFVIKVGLKQTPVTAEQSTSEITVTVTASAIDKTN